MSAALDTVERSARQAGVAVSNVTKRFQGVSAPAAVDNVSFEAPRGVITALLGPSGSGKSTLLRIVAGLETPDGGNVTIGGQDVTLVSPRLRRVGFVFQSYALFKHLSVFENVAFGLRIKRANTRQIEERVRELLSLVQLPGYAARFPNQLSGGQRQRVALARALATEPEVLLLDEPFGALDAKVRVELRRWLLELQERTQKTTLLVTHDQEEAFELAQHVVLLSDGRLEQAGSPEELYERPATRFTASFIGAASVLSSRVERGRVSLGASSLAAPSSSRDGAAAQAFVRPHDISLTRAPADADELALARVERVVRLGAKMQVFLALAGGGSITTELTKAELDQLEIEPGSRVLVDVRDAKVFVEEG